MSNLIKYPFVNLQGKEAKVIRYEAENTEFVPEEQKKKAVLKSVEEVEKEEEKEKKNSDFSAGFPVSNLDGIFKQKLQEAEKEAAAILESARMEAAEIVREAREQAEEVQENARREGTVQGKEEGLLEAKEETDRIREELFARKKEQEQEYERMVHEAEESYVNVLCSLIRKLTGIIVSDRKDVILHLIRSGISDMEPSKHYIIRVCTSDLLYIESNKEDIIEKTGIAGSLEIQEEKGLAEGECIIETDKQMIDCGFRTQLENLVSTLRMLV